MTPLLLLLAATPTAVDYGRDVKPILEAACVSCHGPKKRKAELRLDSRAAALTGGITGPAIVPGKSGDSLLLKRVLGEGGEDRMPLKADALKPEQVAVLRRWIDAGAPWPEEAAAAAGAADGSGHWAYRKPERA